ncbi:MAG: hypothetical protein RL380_388, partial [Verrucomicrobiota bacterium]
LALTAALGFAAAFALLPAKQSDFAKQQAAWLAEKSDLEAALASAKGRVTAVPGATRVVEVTKQISPAEILERLKILRVVADQPRTTRLLAHQFETLAETGVAALPIVREFLAGNVDVDYDTGGQRRNNGPRTGQLPLDFNVPPSLRLGLFEMLKNTGGADAEKILADTLATTGRGIELAYLARALEVLSPGKYRAAALAAAHELLAHPLADAADKSDHFYLLATLMFLNDPSFAEQAKAQLVQADGKIDAAALKYLQQTQPKETLAIAMQTYRDPRVTDARDRERLAQVALDTAGVDPLADKFFRDALADTTLPSDNRRNLAEDFADHGYTNAKDPTADDFLKMQNRLAQLQQLAAEATDPLVIAGLAEAQKDLNKSIANYAAAHPPQ